MSRATLTVLFTDFAATAAAHAVRLARVYLPPNPFVFYFYFKIKKWDLN
jgi:hypothetical protein